MHQLRQRKNSIMNKLNINNHILSTLPEFKFFLEDVSIEKEPFFYFGNLGMFIKEAINNKENSIIERSFLLINQLLEIKDDELRKLLINGVLEVLTDTAESQKIASEKLNATGKKLFNDLFKRFNKLI